LKFADDAKIAGVREGNGRASLQEDLNIFLYLVKGSYKTIVKLFFMSCFS
jgi:hypothetical protein